MTSFYLKEGVQRTLPRSENIFTIPTLLKHPQAEPQANMKACGFVNLHPLQVLAAMALMSLLPMELGDNKGRLIEHITHLGVELMQLIIPTHQNYLIVYNTCSTLAEFSQSNCDQESKTPSTILTNCTVNKNRNTVFTVLSLLCCD